jgi:hypothetical protein
MPYEFVESRLNRIVPSIEDSLMSVSDIIKILSQEASRRLKHISNGVLDTSSVIEVCIFSSPHRSGYVHLGFQRFFTFAALSVITFFLSLLVVVLISMIPLISTVLRGIVIVLISPSRSFHR